MDNRAMDIATTILTSVVISGIFGFIIRSWIKITFAKELETHKDNLSRQTAQNNFRFSQVFNQTEKVIATTYAMLLELKDASEGITDADILKRDERFTAFLEKAQKFLKFYEPNKIYIPRATAKKIRSLFYTLQDAVRNWHVAMQMSSLPTTDAAQRKNYFEKYFATTKEIPDMLNQIEKDFQTILGFPMEEDDK
jgi:hypothetical protein